MNEAKTKIEGVKAIIFDYARTLWNPEVNELYPHALELVERLGKKYKMCLIRRNSRNVIVKEEIMRFFEFDIGEGTKEEKHFLQAFEKLGVKPSECVVIGDRAQLEITLGQALGCKTIWIKAGKYSELLADVQPTFTVSSLEDLDALLL